MVTVSQDSGESVSARFGTADPAEGNPVRKASDFR
jgi:hypothetical protein